MLSTSPQSKPRLHILTHRPTTPDLTSLSLDAAALSPRTTPRAATPLSAERTSPAADASIASPRRALEGARPRPPRRPLPTPPMVSPVSATQSVMPVLPQACELQRSASEQTAIRDTPIALLRRTQTLPPDDVLSRALSSVAPPSTISPADQWLAHYLLREPGPYGLEQLLAEDMLGAGILGTSVTGTRPLTRHRAASSHRSLNSFKGFVEGLGAWSRLAPQGCEAAYQVAAMRIGQAHMRAEEVLDLSCLGLESLPEQLGNLIRLQVLDVRHNRLTRMPTGCYDMRALRRADLRHNPFAVRPVVMSHLQLDALDIDADVPPAAVHMVGGRF